MIVKNMMGLAPGVTTTSSGDTAMPRVLRDRLAQLRQPRGWAVVGRAGVERLLRRFLDMCGRVEIGLADLQVDDLASGALELARAGQYLERRLGSEPGHSWGDVHEDPPRGVQPRSVRLL
jgi:hypothetical protein